MVAKRSAVNLPLAPSLCTLANWPDGCSLTILTIPRLWPKARLGSPNTPTIRRESKNVADWKAHRFCNEESSGRTISAEYLTFRKNPSLVRIPRNCSNTRHVLPWWDFRAIAVKWASNPPDNYRAAFRLPPTQPMEPPAVNYELTVPTPTKLKQLCPH